MVDRTTINEHLTVGNVHPNSEQLGQLAQEGFKSVANLRTTDERNQPLAPDEEQRQVERVGMSYLHYPVTSDDLSDEVVDAFREQIRALPWPLFAHCASGMRSGAFIMMHVASEMGLSGEETLKEAERMGFECGQPRLRNFVRSYVDRHRDAD